MFLANTLLFGSQQFTSSLLYVAHLLIVGLSETPDSACNYTQIYTHMQ